MKYCLNERFLNTNLYSLNRKRKFILSFGCHNDDGSLHLKNERIGGHKNQSERITPTSKYFPLSSGVGFGSAVNAVLTENPLNAKAANRYDDI